MMAHSDRRRPTSLATSTPEVVGIPLGAPKLDVYFSTVSRRADVREGGELVRLDWDTKRVVAKVPVFPSDPEVVDLNPRGGTRGGRGVAIVDDRVLVNSYHSIIIHGRDLDERRRITHPLMAGLHELADPGDGTLWVAATAIDAALRVDLGTGEIVDSRWPRADSGLRSRLQIEDLPIDRTADQRHESQLGPHRGDLGHLHLNAITFRDGALLGLANHHGAILDLDANEVVLQHPELRMNHNLVALDDGTVLTSGTTRGSVLRWDLDRGVVRSSVRLLSSAWVRRHERRHRIAHAIGRLAQLSGLAHGQVAHPLFVRGVAGNEGSLFVGISPAAILELDSATGRVVDAFAYSTDVRTCIHGIALAR